MHGYDITLDHRSYKDQGIDIEPQVKLGKGVKEQERRAKIKNDLLREKEDLFRDKAEEVKTLDQSLDASFSQGLGKSPGFIHSTPTTDRVPAFREVQLRNLYRIRRRPETVFDIVTRHHATFMWGDVQKVLGRYVDEAELFQRLDSRLRNSKELLLLKMEGVRDQEGHIEAPRGGPEGPRGLSITPATFSRLKRSL